MKKIVLSRVVGTGASEKQTSLKGSAFGCGTARFAGQKVYSYTNPHKCTASEKHKLFRAFSNMRNDFAKSENSMSFLFIVCSKAEKETFKLWWKEMFEFNVKALEC